jgi:ribosome biogenesis GTPase A
MASSSTVVRQVFRKKFDYRGPLAWFPGHMAKTQRLIAERLARIDMVIEVRDARAPFSSANTTLDTILGRKQRVVVYNKADLANHNLFAVCDCST